MDVVTSAGVVSCTCSLPTFVSGVDMQGPSGTLFRQDIWRFSHKRGAQTLRLKIQLNITSTA